MSSVIYVPSTVTTVNVIDDATATVSTTTATDTQVVVSNLQGPQGPPGAGGALGYYGAFSDTTTQTIAAINTAYTMTLNTTDESSGVSRGTPTSRIIFASAGTYNFQWSGQFQNTNAKDEDINVWIRINGTDVVGSNGLVNVPAKHSGADGHIIAGWNYVDTFAANDYIELVWSSSATAVTLQAYSATSPAPSTASLIVTAQQVMYTQVGPTGPSGVIAVNAPITNAGTSTSANLSVSAASTSASGVVQLSDSTSTTSSVLASTPTATKAAYDLANTANTTANAATPATRTISTTAPLTGGGDLSANRTLAVSAASTSAAGVVQLSDSTSTTSSVLAATPTAVKAAYDAAVASVQPARSISTTAPIAGGGDLSANRTLSLNLGSSVTTSGSNLVVDSTVVPYLANANTFTASPQQVTVATAANVGLIVKGAASQSGNLQEWQDSTSAVKASVDSTGVLNTYSGFRGYVSGAETFSFGISANGGIELGKTNGSTSTPFIDFHSGATAVDYDVRVIASGGTGTSGGGTLTVTGGTIALPAGTTVGGNTISGTWANYTPTWTNFTVGNGNVVSRYAQIGKVVFVNIIVTLGTTSSVTGIIYASLPVTGANTSNIGNYTAGIYDATPFNIFMGTAFFNSTTQVGLKAQNSAGTYLVSAYTSATIPMTWTTSDAFQFNFNYEAA